MTPSPAVPTLEDVARVADVSTATVSRCLNAPNKLSKKTREKVTAAVTALGYTPNFNARAMAAKRTHTIGAVIPTMDNAIFARGLQALQERLQKSGYTLLVASSAYQPDTEAEQIRALVARGVDGLLLIGYDRADDVYGFLERRAVPTVIAWAHAENGPLPAVGFDNRAAMAALAGQVFEMGHRAVAMISGIAAGNDRAAARQQGVRDAMTAQGLDPTGLPIREVSYSIEAGANAMAALLDAQPDISCIICGNDVLAAGALQEAKSMGLRVPQDISITGFDDIELARIVTPALTTVHVPHGDMGRLAGEALIKMIETQQPGQSIKLDCPMQLRASLRPLDSG